jgi:tetratricopeptide (TPR) repeat protein
MKPGSEAFPKAGRSADPDTPQGAFQRGLAYLEQGQSQKAVAQFESLAASNPNQAAVFTALGVAYRRQGQLDKAVEAYRKAIGLQSGSVEAHYNLGIAYREKGQFKEAESEYRMTLAIDPNFSQAHYNLAILYDLYFNRPAEAVKHYKEYKRLSGGNELLEVWIEDLERRAQGSGGASPAAVKN